MVALTRFFYRLCLYVILFIAIINNVACEKVLGLKEPATDPVAVFDDFWHAIDRYYALFPVKGINWDSVYAVTKPQINAGLSGTDLFKKINTAMDALKDGHVSLSSPQGSYTYEGFYKTFPVNFNLANIKKNYLLNQYTQYGPVIYKAVDNTGYLYYASFREDMQDSELDALFAALAPTKGLIIDVRSNNGGSLLNVERLFSRFINARKLVRYEVHKKGPGHNEFYEKEPAYVSPAGSYYSKPVIVLTNRGCFSACNDFVMYMSYLPNVRIAGDQTGGGGAVPANYLLVNGWKLQYSSSMTLSPDGISIENGIRPGIVVGITPIDETTGRDPILEKAYQLLQ